MPVQEIKMITFPIKQNSKSPAVKGWQNLKKSVLLSNSKQNKGLLTGKDSNIIVLDIDFHNNLKVHPITEALGNDIFERLIKLTYSVRTPTNGYHFYFKYNEYFKTTKHFKPLSYDIISTGGFIMCPPSKIEGYEYIKLNNLQIEEMPNFLIKYLLKNMDKSEEYSKDSNTIIDNLLYVFDKNTLSYILDKLESKFYDDYHKWLVITTCIKKIVDNNIFNNKEELINVWDEWSKKSNSYNQSKNYEIFRNLKSDKIDISLLFSYSKVKPLGFFKPVEKLNYPEDTLYINKKKLGYDFIQSIDSNNKILIKSDTGTGKTTSFNHYIKETKNKFISLVSRRLLGKEQQENLKKLDIDSKFYLDDEFDYGDNIIICADSLLKIGNFDFSEYVIFIDEFNSVVEYILNSSTFIKNNRRIVFNIIKNMIYNSKLFIGVDADISVISYNFLESITKFKFIVNENKYFEGVPYYLYNDENLFIENLKKEDKFILASDSATIIESLNTEIDFYKIIGRNKKNEIVDEEQEEGNSTNFKSLDSEDKLGFSPIIIYGQDSTMKRKVYAWFKGHTITPPQMIQQIARCRNPIEVHICYTNNRSFYPVYNNIEETEEDILNSIKIYKTEYKSVEELNADIYYELLKKLEYKLDCYKTSKFIHLNNLLRERGFDFKGFLGKKNKVIFKEMREKVKENIEKDFEDDINKKNVPEYISKINSLLNIPKDKLINYSDFFTNDYKLKEHFIISKLFFGDKNDFINKIEKSKEFISNKMKGTEARILYLNKLMDILNININKIYKDDFSDVKKYNFIELEKEYKSIVRTSKKKLGFEYPAEVYKGFGTILRGLIGDCLTSERISKDKVRFMTYNYNFDNLNIHLDLIKYRQSQKINNDEIDFIDDDNEIDDETKIKDL